MEVGVLITTRSEVDPAGEWLKGVERRVYFGPVTLFEAANKRLRCQDCGVLTGWLPMLAIVAAGSPPVQVVSPS